VAAAPKVPPHKLKKKCNRLKLRTLYINIINVTDALMAEPAGSEPPA
jgi:hypothetical protein